MYTDFESLESCDLIKGYVYKGGIQNNLSSEPISKLLPVGNQSGVRFTGKFDNPSLGVLFTTFRDKEWPDWIEGNKLTYYGDNKTPGKELHGPSGNRFLKYIFNCLHLQNKENIPPIFLFSKAGSGFDRKFEGLVVPGYETIDEEQDLLAFWRTKDGKQYQNYKAIFTLLNTETISRKWIDDIKAGNTLSGNCPTAWRTWRMY